MSLLGADIAFWTLAAVAVASAVVVVLVRETMRMALGLGTLLLATAGLFVYFGAGFLAAAQVFVYVGGVLVLLIFAIMVTRRSGEGVPRLSSRHDPVTFLMCAMLSGAAGWLLLRDVPPAAAGRVSGGPEAVAAAFLGPMVGQFELLGVLLLAALVAVISVVGGERR